MLPPRCIVCKSYISINSNHLTKTGGRTKESLTQFSSYCFEQKYFFPKNADFLQKNVDISKFKRSLVLKRKSFKTAYVCVHMYQISSFQHNSNAF